MTARADAFGRFVLVALIVHTLAPLAAIAQTNPPQPPTNLRIVNGPVASSCPTGQIGTPPNCVPIPPAPVASGKQWTLAFAEEFNGTSLDTTRLTPCFDWNLGGCTASFNTGKEHYQPSQVQVSNGTAKLTAPEPVGVNGRRGSRSPAGSPPLGGCSVPRGFQAEASTG